MDFNKLLNRQLDRYTNRKGCEMYWDKLYHPALHIRETVVQRYSVIKVFLENSQNSQENVCARVSGTGVFL